MAFPEEAPHPQWQPTSTLAEAASRRSSTASARASRGGFFGIAWVVVRIWRGIAAVVGPVMRKASDLAMAPYDRAEARLPEAAAGGARQPVAGARHRRGWRSR